MLRRIKDRLLSAARKIKLKHALIALMLGLSASLIHGQVKEAKKVYALIVLGSYGPMLVPVDQVMVKNVSRELDGSVCFNEAQSGERGCIKANQYYLKPLNVR